MHRNMKYLQPGKCAQWWPANSKYYLVVTTYIINCYFRLQSIPNLLSVFLTPIVGISVDWFGHRTAQLTGAALLLFIAHNLIYTQLIGPVLPLLLIGLAYRYKNRMNNNYVMFSYTS